MAEIHQSIPAAPSDPPPGADPRTLAFFPLDGKFPGAGTLGLSNPRGGDDKKGQKPRPRTVD